MPLAVLAARGCYKWIELHDAVSKQGTQFIHQLTSTAFSCLKHCS